MNERMINQFMEIVQIESESGNEANFMNYLKAEFEKLGGEVTIDSYGNLIAKFAEKGFKISHMGSHPEISPGKQKRDCTCHLILYHYPDRTLHYLGRLWRKKDLPFDRKPAASRNKYPGGTNRWPTPTKRSLVQVQ